jgi:hypothetical protein
MALGGHGEVCERMNGEWKITLRQNPTVWNLDEVCMGILNHRDLDGWNRTEFLGKVKSHKALVTWLTEYVMPCVEHRNPDSSPDYSTWLDYDEDEQARLEVIRWDVLNVSPKFGRKPTTEG